MKTVVVNCLSFVFAQLPPLPPPKISPHDQKHLKEPPPPYHGLFILYCDTSFCWCRKIKQLMPSLCLCLSVSTWMQFTYSWININAAYSFTLWIFTESFGYIACPILSDILKCRLRWNLLLHSLCMAVSAEAPGNCWCFQLRGDCWVHTEKCLCHH